MSDTYLLSVVSDLYLSVCVVSVTVGASNAIHVSGNLGWYIPTGVHGKNSFSEMKK